MSSEQEASNLIGELLERDEFLKKVLGFLSWDDGLDFCRLVCRRWNKVVNTLPVKLTITDATDLPAVVAAFPEAESLAVVCDSALLIDCDNYTSLDLYDLVALHVTALSNLRHFTVRIDHLILRNWEYPHVILEGLLSLRRLSSLNIDLFPHQKLRSPDRFYSGIENLTNLTCLTLRCNIDPPDQPLTGVQKIRRLHCNKVMAGNGDFMFPSLTCLKELSVIYGRIDLQRLLPFADSLQSLEIRHSRFLQVPPAGRHWRILRAFKQLKSLELFIWQKDIFTSYTEIRASGEFCEALEGLDMLRRLHVRLDLGHLNVSECLGRMTKLRSLFINGAENENQLSSLFSRLSSLTQLTIAGSCVSHFLGGLTGLLDLEVCVPDSKTVDASMTLANMPHLERLKLTVRFGSTDYAFLTSCSGFSSLTNLKTIDLKDIIFDEHFFPSLASLPDLTEMKLSIENYLEKNVHLHQITLLSNLRHLELEYYWYEDPLHYLVAGSFPRLRTLQLFVWGDYLDRRQEVRNRFPHAKMIKF